MLLRYDFWESTEWWTVIRHYHDQLRLLSLTEPAGLSEISFRGDEFGVLEVHGEEGEAAAVEVEKVWMVWRGLAALGRLYEEVCREWWLPTQLGQATS